MLGNSQDDGTVGYLKLLVVDDNEDIRVLLKRNLVQAGYEVELAASGKEAFEILSSQTFSAVVSDILMPDGSGTWLAIEVRKTGNQVPIILISASGDITRSEALKTGANEFIKKPLDIFKLEEILERIAI